MAAEGIPPNVRLTQGIAKLKDSTKPLHNASQILWQPVDSLESTLSNMNVRVPCWTEITSSTEDGVHYWNEYVGWVEVNDQWCIALKTCESAEYADRDTNVKIKKFNDAPYYLRIKAIDKLPELIEALIQAVDATTARMQKKVQPARELADALNALSKKE